MAQPAVADVAAGGAVVVGADVAVDAGADVAADADAVVAVDVGVEDDGDLSWRALPSHREGSALR